MTTDQTPNPPPKVNPTLLEGGSVITPGYRMAILAMAVIIGSGLIWSVVGRIPVPVEGIGILLNEGGIRAVHAQSDGVVEEIYVQVGQMVNPGQLLAKINQSQLAEKLMGLEERLTFLQAEKAQTERYVARAGQLNAAELAQQRNEVRQTLAVLRQKGVVLTAQLNTQKKLLQQGLITLEQLFETQSAGDSNALAILQNEAKLRNLDVQQLSNADQLLGRRDQISESILELQSEITLTKQQLASARWVKATVAGQVASISVAKGQLVAAGGQVASLYPDPDAGLMAYVFVSALEGKQIRSGQPVQLTPTFVKKQIDGSIVGSVLQVSEFSVGEGEIMSLVQNEALADFLLKETSEIPLRVTAKLASDPNSPSGFRWTSGKGPDIKITPGTFVQADIIVSYQSPIDYVIPQINKVLGI